LVQAFDALARLAVERPSKFDCRQSVDGAAHQETQAVWQDRKL
jgi:hypothetical protein